MAGSIKSPPFFVVDASFVLSVLLPDEKVLRPYKKILNLFEKANVIFLSPEILKYEVANGLKSAFKQKRITRILVEKLYENFLKMDISYQKIDFEETLALSMEGDLSFYDASYVYLVRLKKCKLLTLDKNLGKLSVLK